jgi:hypothetical protein
MFGVSLPALKIFQKSSLRVACYGTERLSTNPLQPIPFFSNLN